jgi:GR25 family glycosyltransferase involved in LPS biosynthesis
MDIGEYGRSFHSKLKSYHKKAIDEPVKTKPTFTWQDKYKRVKKIISFSLWGDCELYSAGAIENAIAASYVYPEFECWFYVGEGVNEKHLEILNKFKNVRIIKKNSLPHQFMNTMWRFEPAFSTGNIVLSRDCDAVVSLKERMAVEEWLNSGRDFHIMRDHDLHCAKHPILAGMFAVRNGVLNKYKNEYDEFIKEFHDSIKTDQNFLKRIYDQFDIPILVHTHNGHLFSDNEENKKFYNGKYTVGTAKDYTIRNLGIGNNRSKEWYAKPFKLDFDNYAYVISINSDRYNIFKKRVGKLGNIKKFEGIIPKDKGRYGGIGSRGCAESHLSVIKKARDNKWPYVIIFEDDSKINESFNLDDVNEFLDNNDWDIFYFLIQGDAGEEIKVNNSSFYRCQTIGGHAYVIKSSAYQTILDHNKNARCEIDVVYKNIIHKKLKVFGATNMISQDKNIKSDRIRLNSTSLDFKYSRYINLDISTDRMHRFLENNGKFNIQRFEAIKDNNGTLGCFKSHIEIIKIAKKYNWPYAIIFEDDVKILDNFNIEAINKFLSKNDWDLFTIRYNDIDNTEIIETIDGVKFCTSNFFQTAAYIVKNTMYDEVLKLPKGHIDYKYTALALKTSKNILGCTGVISRLNVESVRCGVSKNKLSKYKGGISFCATALGREDLLKNSIDSLVNCLNWVGISKYEIIISFWNSPPLWINKHSNIKAIKAEGEFSRGHGLNIAGDNAKYDKIFFFDIDMIFSQEIIKESVLLDNKTAYFPVFCYLKMDKSIGNWENLSWGNVCVSKEIFNNVRWQEYTTWGREDSEFRENIKKHGFKIKRNKVYGFLHQWHQKQDTSNNNSPVKFVKSNNTIAKFTGNVNNSKNLTCYYKTVDLIVDGKSDFVISMNEPEKDTDILTLFEPYQFTDRSSLENNILKVMRTPPPEFKYLLDREDFLEYNFFQTELHTEVIYDYDKLIKMKKHNMSMIASGKSRLQYHKIRKDVRDIILKEDNNIHVFGKNLPKSLPPNNKKDGLAPYWMSIAFENSDEPYYITEKFYDCIVNVCVPITNSSSAYEIFGDCCLFINFKDKTPELIYKQIVEEYYNYDISNKIENIKKLRDRILYGDLRLSQQIAKIATIGIDKLQLGNTKLEQ